MKKVSRIIAMVVAAIAATACAKSNSAVYRAVYKDSPSTPSNTNYKTVLPILLDDFIDSASPYDDPVMEIYIASSCYAFELEEQGLSTSQAMERLDRLLFESLGSLARHQQYLIRIREIGFSPKPLLSKEQVKAECNARQYEGVYDEKT